MVSSTVGPYDGLAAEGEYDDAPPLKSQVTRGSIGREGGGSVHIARWVPGARAIPSVSYFTVFLWVCAKRKGKEGRAARSALADQSVRPTRTVR